MQIGELYRKYELSDKLEILDDALTNKHLFEFFEQIIYSHRKIEDVKRDYPFIQKFFDDRVMITRARLDSDWAELGTGRVIIDEPITELTFTSDILATAQKNVWAVSFRDEDYWDLPEGQAYLEQHQILLSKGISVARIFILDKDDINSQRKMIFIQIKMGIKAYVLRSEHVSVQEREDFVIYDEAYVRFAKPIENTGTLKAATLSLQAEEVRQYLSRFKYLRSQECTSRKVL